MQDLTLLFITAGERPKHWAEFHAEHLAKLPYPMITLRDEVKKGYENIYRRMLDGAKQATTPYVAIIEDDVLYPEAHFWFRPPLDTFSYNQHRWALFTWGVPTYNWRNRKSNCTLIAPTKLMIDALEERFAKFPNGIPKEWCGELGRERVDKWLGVTVRKSIEWHSKYAVVQINHDDASEERQKRHRKDLGPMKAYDIPVWGRAEDLIKHYA
jgi:hypothetical protein